MTVREHAFHSERLFSSFQNGSRMKKQSLFKFLYSVSFVIQEIVCAQAFSSYIMPTRKLEQIVGNCIAVIWENVLELNK